MSTTLSEQLAEYRTGWRQRVPAERRAAMERNIAYVTETGAGRRALQVGRSGARSRSARRAWKDVRRGHAAGQRPVVVTFHRGGWCPFCNLELKAYQAVLPRFNAAGAGLVAISPEKPDDSMSTAEKNALTFTVLSDVGQKVGKSFGPRLYVHGGIACRP